MPSKSSKPDFDKLNNQRIQEDAQRLYAASSKPDIKAPVRSRVPANGNERVRTRDGIVRSYDAKSASRARNARLESIEAMKGFHAREEQRLKRDRMKRDLVFDEPYHPNGARAQGFQDRHRSMRRQSAPRSADALHDEALEKKERFERERSRRDALLHRSDDRELIDGRGSIDSRAFNERNELVGYTVDAGDRHEPDIDSIETGTKWSSRDGRDIRSMSDSITAKSDLHGIRNGLRSIPGSVKALAVAIAILLIVLLVLLLA